MKIDKADVQEIAIPFKFTFKHALAARNKGRSVIVKLVDEEGRVGFGESAPREYVTGETPASVMEALRAGFLPDLLQNSFESMEDVTSWIEAGLEGLPRNRHAAFCAVELALLDLAGRAFGVSCAGFDGPVVHEEFVFSAVISADGVEAAAKACQLVKAFGFPRVKLKVGISHQTDLEILASARGILGDGVGLRVDANCAWTAEEALRNLEDMARFDLEGVEQPLREKDIAGLKWLTSRSPMPVITDESLATLEDARRLAGEEACHVFNVRISKCGGLFNAFRIRDVAREAGIRCMLGAQVGETAILSAAGRHFAARTPDLLFLEGSYGTILLEEDVAREDLTVGPGGHARILRGAGAGIEVLEEKIAAHALGGFELRARTP